MAHGRNQMIKPETFTVKPADERPARRDGTCFYCSEPIGARHSPTCVIPSKTVVVDVTFRMVRLVPADWNGHDVEFLLNDSSSCSSNVLNDLLDVSKRHREDDTAEEGAGCMCNAFAGVYVKEASEDDETVYGISNDH